MADKHGVRFGSGAGEFFVDFFAVADLKDYYGLAVDLVNDPVVAYSQLAETGETPAERFSEFYGVKNKAVFYGSADAVLDVLRKVRDILCDFGVIFRFKKHYFPHISLWEIDFLAL